MAANFTPKTVGSDTVLGPHLRTLRRMSDIDVEAIRAAGAAIGEAISVFMLNPHTFLAAGYPDPFAAYFAGRGGVLGDATSTTVTAVFAVFEPNLARSCWENGIAVHPASESCRLYWDQLADFGRTYLGEARGWTASPRWARRSSRAPPNPACRCMRAGGPCRWPTLLPPAHCRS